MKCSSCCMGQITFTFLIHKVKAWALILSNYAPTVGDNHPTNICGDKKRVQIFLIYTRLGNLHIPWKEDLFSTNSRILQVTVSVSLKCPQKVSFRKKRHEEDFLLKQSIYFTALQKGVQKLASWSSQGLFMKPWTLPLKMLVLNWKLLFSCIEISHRFLPCMFLSHCCSMQ